MFIRLSKRKTRPIYTKANFSRRQVTWGVKKKALRSIYTILVCLFRWELRLPSVYTHALRETTPSAQARPKAPITSYICSLARARENFSNETALNYLICFHQKIQRNSSLIFAISFA